MAKVQGPLLSFGGSGQIGKSAVFGSWRGVKYARQYVVPANPNTVAQQGVRTVFAMLREQWKRMGALQRAPWDAFALGRKFTGVNAFIGENVRVLNGEMDQANYIGSPGARGGLGAVAIMGAPGGSSGEIDLTFTDPDLPAGWTITNHVGVAYLDAAPTVDFVGPFVVEDDATADAVLTFTGLTPTTDYVVTGWIVYQKPDGSVAYSPSFTAIVTATT